MVRRIVIVGCPGSGKTTMAGLLAARLGVDHLELDAFYHGPGWTPRPDVDFRNAITAAMDEADWQTDGWVACGNYNRQTDGIHVARADTIIWLDLSRRLVMARIVRRTLRRVIFRRELWNGNREQLRNLYRWDPYENIIRWAWVEHPKYRRRYTARRTDGSWDHLTVHHLRRPSEVERFLTTVQPVQRCQRV